MSLRIIQLYFISFLNIKHHPSVQNFTRVQWYNQQAFDEIFQQLLTVVSCLMRTNVDQCLECLVVLTRLYYVYVLRGEKEKREVSDSNKLIQRLRFTFTPNGRREFVPHDQDSPLFSVYSLLLLHKNK